MRLRNQPDPRGRPEAATPNKPRATVETVRTVRRLAAVCPLAAAAGLAPDQTLAEARAICPDLLVLDADPEADRDALASLAAWAERYTPLAAPDPPDGILLDITGCDHLFGGETHLAADLAARLERFALPHRIAIAGTPGAAWALARSATARGPITRIAPHTEAEALSPRPTALLRLDTRTVAVQRMIDDFVTTVGRLPQDPNPAAAHGEHE